MLKKFLAIFLTLALTLTLMPMSVFAVGNTAVQTRATSGSSGNCGRSTDYGSTYRDNATFTVDTDGVLTISGTGEVGQNAFADRDDITSVVFAEGSTISTIGQSAFSGCHSLTSITIPSTVTTLNQNAFFNSGITSITIPDTVTKIRNYVFSDCSSLASVTWNNSVATIPEQAFYRCTSLTSFTIPSTVTTIVGSAFSNSGLTSITIPDTVTTIGDAVFLNCSSLTSATWNSTLTTIPKFTFQGCSSLTSFTIPSTVTTIVGSAFNSSGLTSITIPDSVTTIGSSSFGSCYDLTTVKWPKNIDTISDNTFVQANSIRSFYFDGNSGSITISSYNGSLNNSSNFTFYNLNGGDMLDASGANPVPVKAGYIFDGWYTALEGGTECTPEQSAPGTGTTVYAHWAVGANCGTYDSSNGTYDDNAVYIASGGVATIAGTGEIGESAFANRSDITSVVFDPNNTIDTIGNSTFANTGITEIMLPSTVAEIEGSAFSGCSSLDSVYFKGNLPTLGNSCFDNEVTLYYPLGNSSWENELVRDASDNTFHLDGLSDISVATNAVVFVSDDSTDIEFLSQGEEVETPSAGNRIIKSYYNLTDDTEADASYSATASNFETIGGVTYASSTPMMKVIQTELVDVGTVTKDSDDEKVLAGNATSYGGFDLFGVQVRQIEGDESNNGLRFVTSFSESLLSDIHDFNDTDPDVEYGYVVGIKSRIDSDNDGSVELYKGMPGTKTYDCTMEGNTSDHQNYDDYRIFSLVITYNGADAAYTSTDLVARAYVTYTDANGVQRTYYNTYTGTSVERGGICTNYDAAEDYINNVLKA